MRKPISVLLAASLCIGSVNSWDGTCTANDNESKVDDEFCKTLDNDPVGCAAATGRCSWSVPQEVIDAKAQAREPVLSASATLVSVEGGRLNKDLPPIEAVTEMIGDWVDYHVLSRFMPGEYGAALSPIKSEKDLHITASPYHPLKDVLKPFQCGGQVTPTETERKSKLNPVQTLLRYSRPLFTAKPFKQSEITMDTFTLNAVVANTIMGFVDPFQMNTDRYKVKMKPPNINNMMLYDLDGKPVYLPIDQGFARHTTVTWHKWIATSNDAQLALRKNGVPEDDILKWKQLIIADRWLNGKASRKEAGNQWNEYYRTWLKDPQKANNFVNDNLVYFPQAVATNEELKDEIIKIVNFVWKAIGPDLCLELDKAMKEIFRKINKNEINVKRLLSDKTVLKRVQSQWSFVKKAMNNQAKACAEWSKSLETGTGWKKNEYHVFMQWREMDEQLKTRPLLRDYLSSKTAKTAKVTGKVSVAFEEHRRSRAQTINQIANRGSIPDIPLFVIEDEPEQEEEEPAASGMSKKTLAKTGATETHAVISKQHTDNALEVQYDDALYWNMESGDGPRMKQQHSSLYYDYDAKAAQYLWMALMTAIIVCGCFVIYFVSCTLSGLFFGMVCVEKLINYLRFICPWSKKKRVVLYEDDEDVLSV